SFAAWFVLVASPARRASPPFPYTTLFRSAPRARCRTGRRRTRRPWRQPHPHTRRVRAQRHLQIVAELGELGDVVHPLLHLPPGQDRKSTRLNSSHVKISYAVFCLKKKRTA